MDYFGNNVDGTASASNSAIQYWNNNANIQYTCPGTGQQSVKELGIRMLSGAAIIRLAVYNTSGSLLMQGASTLSFSSDGWHNHTSFVDGSLDAIASPELTGGTNYILSAGLSTGGLQIYKTSVTSGHAKYVTGDITAGFPASLASGSDAASEWSLRCGVEPVSSSLSIPVAMASYRRRRM